MNQYAENLSNVLADAGSNKRYRALIRGRYFPNAESNKPPFDDRVLNVLREFALHKEDLEKCIKHYDAVGYGSIHMPEHLQTALDRFSARHAPTRAWMSGFRQAKRNLITRLGKEVPRKLTPRVFKDDEDIWSSLPKLDAHAGYAYLVTGKRKKGEYRGELFSSWQQILTTVKETGSHGLPILPGSRLQCSGGFENGKPIDTVKHKERLVNMVDYRQIISEMVFSIPVQRAFSRVSFYIGTRNPQELEELVNARRVRSQSWVSLDYKAYDQSIPGWLIIEAFDVLKAMFDSNAFKQWNWLWNAVVYDFIHAPIVGPKGLVFRENGVPSGSMFTQIIDTVVNWLMIETYFLMCASRDEKYHYKPKADMLICGDDNLIFFYDGTDPVKAEAEMLSYIQHNFGVGGQVDKLGHGNSRIDDPHFLSRHWQWSGAWREWTELVGHMVYPERFRNYAANPDLSAEMIVWSYILAYPRGMKDLIDVKSFVEKHQCEIPKWRESAINEWAPGYLKFQKTYLLKRYASELDKSVMDIGHRFQKNEVA